MKKPSEAQESWIAQREKIIGLGERSLRKTYYPELQRRLDELGRFRSLLDQSNDCIFLIQAPSLDFVDVNESACRQLVCSREDFLSHPVGNFIPEDAVARIRELIAAGFAEGKDSHTITTHLYKCSGGKIPVEITIRLVHFNKDLYGVAVARDITERKQAEEALIKANEELEMRVAERTEELEKSRAELELQNVELLETNHKLRVETAERLRAMEELRIMDQLMIQQSRMAAMGEMLGNIAHQWRQPLNVLGLKAQEIGLCYELGAFSKELLDDNIAKIMEILLHMSQTIDDFRDFTAPDKEKTLFRVDRVIAKTVSLIKDNFTELGITIEFSTSGETQINGYPNEYGQVLLNILTNAKDAFGEQRAIDARIMVRSWTEDGRAVVTITDNAGGVREEIMDKIFDPYFTTKELGKGTGVGLFMSKTIIEKNMGGRFTVRNVDGGAEFRIVV